jgi:hypothetical protein
MEPRTLEVTMLRRRSDKRSARRRWDIGQRNRPDAEDYATTLMVAAVASAASNAATVLIEIGRSAGWWH